MLLVLEKKEVQYVQAESSRGEEEFDPEGLDLERNWGEIQKEHRSVEEGKKKATEFGR